MTAQNKVKRAGRATAQTEQQKNQCAQEVATRRRWEAVMEERSLVVGQRATAMALAADGAEVAKRPSGALVGWVAPYLWVSYCDH